VTFYAFSLKTSKTKLIKIIDKVILKKQFKKKGRSKKC